MVLEELWYGNIRPWEQFAESNDEIKKLIGLMGKNREKLRNTLTETEKDLLSAYDDCLNELNAMAEREIFVQAFRLGGRIMLETVVGTKKEE